MKKTFALTDLDCANCAAKIENAVKKIDGVSTAAVNFMSQKLVLETVDDRFDAVFAEVKKVIGKIDADVGIA